MSWLSDLVYVQGDPVLSAINVIAVLMILELFAVVCGYLGGLK